MLHAATPPRRHDRARRAAPLPPNAVTAPRARRLSSLDIVAVQIIAGFVAPLPLIQLGHWCFGWTNVAVMFGGQ